MARIGAAAIANCDYWCAAMSEAQKCKFAENRLRIDGRCVTIVSAAETAI